MFTTVATYKSVDRQAVTQVIRKPTKALRAEKQPSWASDAVARTSINESWYSFGNWFLYKLTDKTTAIWRAEVFRDNGGARTGFSDNFYVANGRPRLQAVELALAQR